MLSTPYQLPEDWQQAYQYWAQSCQHPALKAFYEAGIAALDSPLETAPLVAIDIETTGLNAEQDDIVSIGVVDFSLQGIRLNSAQYWLAKPHGPLTSESVTIHEITHADIRHAPRLSSFLDEVLEAIQGKIVVAHCAAIERPFLYHAAMKHFQEPLLFPVLDTMALEASITYKPWWRRFGRPTSIRLDASRQRYQLPRYRAHQALMDAVSCAELLQAQAAHHLDAQKPAKAYCV